MSIKADSTPYTAATDMNGIFCIAPKLCNVPTRTIQPLLSIFFLLALLLPTDDLYAHSFGQVQQNCYLQAHEKGLMLSLVMQMDAGILTFIPDKDQDGIVDFTEWNDLLNRIESKLRSRLRIQINNKLIKPVFQPPGNLSFDPRGMSYGATGTFYYLIPLPATRTQNTEIIIADESFSVAGPADSLNFFIDAAIEPMQVQPGGNFWQLALTLPPGKNKTSTADTTLVPEGGPPVKITAGQTEQSSLLNRLQEKDFSALFIASTLLTAMFLGAAHALTPGHGKTMVSAFLVGTRGKIRDAFIIGGTVAFTHVASVLLLGFIILYFSQTADIRAIQPWIGAASGSLVFFIGYWILASQAVSHNHNHHHHHSHEPGAKGTNSLTSLFTTGIAGGMVPCPSAIVVLLAAIAMQKITLGLLIIFAFSLGLAAVLIVLAVLAVTASRSLENFDMSKKWIKRLPLLSSLLVMIAGIAIVAGSLINGNILTFHIKFPF